MGDLKMLVERAEEAISPSEVDVTAISEDSPSGICTSNLKHSIAWGHSASS
jgi:hypothetical protein